MRPARRSWRAASPGDGSVSWAWGARGKHPSLPCQHVLRKPCGCPPSTPAKLHWPTRLLESKLWAHHWQGLQKVPSQCMAGRSQVQLQSSGTYIYHENFSLARDLSSLKKAKALNAYELQQAYFFSSVLQEPSGYQYLVMLLSGGQRQQQGQILEARG